MKHLTADELKTIIFPDMAQALRTFFSTPAIRECVIVQKCNCVEIYIAHDAIEKNEFLHVIRENWEQLIGHTFNPDLWEKTRTHDGKEAIFHLFNVTCSMESLIIGDNQVLSQVTSAYDLAHKQGTVKEILSHVFREAFLVAKKVYTQTRMHDCGVSLGRVAVALVESKLSIPAEVISVVGSGQIAEVVVNAIQERWKTIKIKIITRRPEYISKIYQYPTIEGHARNNLIKCARESDAIILCTDSSKPVISIQELQEVVAYGKLKILIDLGMPPNAEPGEIPNLSTYLLADVQEFGKTKSQKRLEEIKIAEDIIGHAYDEFENTTIEYKKNKILKKLGPEIHKAVQKNDIESSVMGVVIRLLRKLNIDELNAIESAVDNIAEE